MDLNLDDFVSRVNSDLVGKITNLASRGAQMINKSCSGQLGKMDDDSRALLTWCREKVPEVLAAYEKRDFCRVMVLVREMADRANQLFDAKMPWKLVKEDLEATRSVLTGTLNLFRVMAICLKPILPQYAEKVEQLFGESNTVFADINKDIEAITIGAYEHLAARVDAKAVAAMVEASKEDLKASTKTINEKDAKKAVRQLATKPAETVFPEPLAPEMSFNDFVKADLRVAQVVAAEVVEGSDKLLRLTLDIGEAKPRNVFAGIRSSYAPEDLLGKQVVMIANLPPRKMRFGISEGMVLASTDPDGSFRVMQPLTPTAPGARLH
jgi:methionyl-tRNA synthetase